MNSEKQDIGAETSSLEDELLLKVAQRADEIWHAEGRGRGSDLVYWLRAEREVMGVLLERAMAGFLPGPRLL